MSHAEAVHTLHPTAGSTDALVAFVDGLRHAALSDEVRHYARRHLLDTVGVMIAGAGGTIASRAEAMLAAVRAPGQVPVPGRARSADLIDAAFLGGTAAHGIELDDGHTKGSAHPGCAVVPASLALGFTRNANGKSLIEALVTGYETLTAIARACHPELRQRGFHPTGAVSVFGAATASAKLLDLSAQQIANTLGIAASSSAGLFAFVNGGADIKRLHAGHAAREGLQAALFAQQGIEGPPSVLEARDGFWQAFAFGPGGKPRAIELPLAVPFNITDCYIKPNACCRHLQPAVEALIAILNEDKITPEEIKQVEAETYRIAAAHAETGWNDYASAQLSFPYLMALAMRYRSIKIDYFEEQFRRDPALATLAAKLHVSTPAEIDKLYPQLRPARVTVTTARGKFTRRVDDALGSRLVPLGDDGLMEKFHDLVAPVLGETRASELAQRLWAIEDESNVAPLVKEMAKQ
jgi:2-methylcitrate dehydratase PrpD